MENAKKYIYFHLCTIGDWYKISIDILDKIIDCGLYEEIDELRLFVYGAKVNTNHITKNFPKKYGSKIKVCFSTENISLREVNTLDILSEDAKKEDFYALYLHSKGATSWNFEPETIAPMDSWLEYMLYFNVLNWKKCLDLLKEGFSTVGVNLKKQTQDGKYGTHYSGNIWWSSSKHIKNLELPSQLGLYGTRLDAENWICSGDSNSISLWETDLNLYREVYNKENYINKGFKLSSYVVKKGKIK